jgi:hypothetical protein
MRTQLTLLVVSASALLLVPPARACSCVFSDSAWPNGLKEVPWSVHVLVWTQPSSDPPPFELREVPTPDGGWADDIEKTLVSAQHPLPRQGKAPNPLPEPSRTRSVAIKRSNYVASIGLTMVVELVPDEPLKSSTRYVVIRPAWHDSRLRVVGIFATGSVDADVRQPVSAVEVAEVYPPDPSAQGSACQSSEPFAVLSVKPADSPDLPRVLAVWAGASPDLTKAPDFIIARNGRAVLGVTSTCDRFNVELPAAGGATQITVREKKLSGQLGRSFDGRVVVPEPDGRKRPGWDTIFK